MGIMNKRDSYGWMAVLLHWLLFLLLVGLVASGKYSHSLSPQEKSSFLIGIHKQVGVAVFVLMAFRLLWKLINSSVQSLIESTFMSFLAGLVHWTMYAAVLGQATIGVAMSQAAGRKVIFFNTVEVPPVAEYLTFLPSSAEVLREWHHHGATILIVLVAVHVLAAIIHRFSHYDSLRRMWFGYTPPTAKELRQEM